MKIVSIEPTPSPNNMKLNMDERIPDEVKGTYTQENWAEAPDYVRKLLNIDGVKSVFQVADFISVERYPKADWQDVLSQVRQVFEEDGASAQAVSDAVQGNAFGEVNVLVQMFKGIPIQIKLTDGTEERRFALPERFRQAVMKIQHTSDNYILERKWEERGVRYGEMDDVGKQVAEEIAAAYDDNRLERLVTRALEPEKTVATLEELSLEEIAERLDDPDWKVRYAALEQVRPSKESVDVLVKAMNDPKLSVKRLAVAYLGMVEDPIVLPHLFRALKDKSATIRRTAGDCLSDLGDPAAIGPMTEALKDPNKIVRWRAARFLYEVGDETAIPALREAQDDPEFEVQLQVKMALERIESGHAAEGTVWQQMTRSRQKKS